ncbi:hypothetical protein, partial [Shewanella chilikensis]|uniref:hypothetical protein n=1 Tax=Shewanella chilikensis TaxID=558541 RepID=UPI003AADA752
AIGRTYQSFDGAGTVTATATPGTAAAPGSLAIVIGDNTENIALQADMTAQDVQDKINSLGGISDVVVTGGGSVPSAAVASTQTLAFTAGGDDVLTMTLDGGTPIVITDVTDLTSMTTAINDAATYSVAYTNGTDATGGYTISKLDGTDFTIDVGITDGGNTTDESTITLNGQTAITAGGKDTATTTNGEVAGATTTAVPFTIDLTNAKLDAGITGVSVGGTDMTLAAGTTFKSIAGIDLSTAAGAQDAISVIDA